jgi:hypothetical protein
MKTKSTKNKTKKQKVKIVQSVQSFSPIKDVKKGIIITKDNRYIKILEFSPINFMLRSARDQNLIIQSFATVIRQCPNKVQFKVISKKADIEKHTNKIKNEIITEQNFLCKKLQQETINLINEVGMSQGISRRFFIIFEYNSLNTTIRSFDDIYFSLQNTSNRIISSMSHCTNEFIEPENDDEYVMEILYSICCRKKSEVLPFSKKTLISIAKYMESDTISLQGNDIPYIPVNELICPEQINIQNPKYMIVDGLYYAFAYIPSVRYSVNAYGGWLSMLINMGEGIDIDFFIHKQPKESIVGKIGQKLRMNKVKIKETQDTNTDYDTIENAIASGYYLKDGLLKGGEDFYYMNTLLTITADTLEELKYKLKEIETYINTSCEMGMQLCNYEHEQAFLSTLPLCDLNKNLYNKSKRNALTSSVASAYMFTSYEMNDENGILFGLNSNNNSLVMVDIFDSRKYKNANMAIVGTSGSGKTFTMQCMALRMRQKQIQVFILAPLKGHEFKRAANAVGGQYVKISAGSPHCINIMEIRKKDINDIDMVDGIDELQDSILSEKVQRLHIFFSLLIPDLSTRYEEKQLLDEAIIETYKRKGITTDNKSLIDPEETDKYKEMPILGDLYLVLRENQKTERLANILNRYVNGSASSFNKQTNVNLDNKYIVLDISNLTNEILPVGMFIALDYIWDKAKEDRTKKKAIFLDELWNLIGASSNQLAAEFVLEIFKIIRGYGGSAIAATQDLNDFFALEDGKYGKGIINNSKTKIILNLEQEEADRVQKTLNLTNAETQNIVKFDRGHGLLSTNSNNILVEFVASKLEESLITTDRSQLEELAKTINL